MTVPRLVQGAALILWGWNTDLLILAIPLSILLEFRHFTRRRWNLAKPDFYRVADITTLLVAAVVIYLFITEKATHFLITVVQLTPLLFYPLTLVFTYSTWTKLPLDILVFTLRRQPDTDQAEWDIDRLYIGVCLVAAGTNATASLLFFPAAALIICWTLWPQRPQRYSVVLCLLLVGTVYFAGTFAHQGIHQLHIVIRDKSVDWLADLFINQGDPFKTKTAIGSIGRLKQSEEILFRVDMAADYPLLLQEASYDLPSDNIWQALNSSFKPLDKMGEYTWRVQEGSNADHLMTMYLEYATDKGLVPLPTGATTVRNFPALELKQSRYGTVQATGIIPAASFQIRFDNALSLNSGVQVSDDYMPIEYQDLISNALPASVSDATTDSEKVDAVRHYFDDFRYTLYQPEKASQGDPIAYFLQSSKAGHCEYFATVTVLMLRAAGIPARYAVGYSVQEFDPFTGMYVVRKRHAHAWAIAYLDGSWQAVDTTPSVWLELESEQALVIQPLFDFASALLFKIRLWWGKQDFKDYTLWLYITAAVLVLFLAWRLLGSQQVMITESDGVNPAARGNLTGADSPFYLIEKQLTIRGMGRNRSEPLAAWVQRIQQRELLPLLHEHYAWRFDPQGISEQRKTALAQAVDRWLQP